MLQIIGLIVAVYAAARLAQVPVEMTARKEEWLGTPFALRFWYVAVVSLAGLFLLIVLTLFLLTAGADVPRGKV